MFSLPPGFLTSFLKSQYTPLPYPTADFSGQTVIVTGANVGLGLEAARHFARLNAAKVILGCRSLAKGEVAKADIEASTGRLDVVEVWDVDLASNDSVKAFCARAAGLERLDVVVENAGVATPKMELIEGMESTIKVNVVGTFLMALLLLETLKKSGEKYSIVPMLVIVASDAHVSAVFAEQKSSPIFPAFLDAKTQSDRYNTSKLLEILMVRCLGESLTASDSPVIINCLTPGLCYSDLMRNAPLPLAIAASIGKVLLGRSSEVGSRTLLAAATAGKESHGKYMADCVVVEPSAWVGSEEGVQAGKRVYDELLSLLGSIEPGIETKI